MSLIVLSQREARGGLSGHLAFGAWNEAEEVLVSAGAAELIRLNQSYTMPTIRARRWAGRAVRKVAGQSINLPALRSRLDRSEIEGAHVLFVAYRPSDFSVLERLSELRRHAATISMWLPEVWPSTLRNERLSYEGLDMLDHIFVGVEEAVEPFRVAAPSAKVHRVPPATDVFVFGARTFDHERGIDVLGIGRRDPNQHAAILDWADRNDKLYVYDTVAGPAADWMEHRHNLANWYRHSKVALCNYAKHDMPNLTSGSRVVPGRLFEGMAAGAILVGMAPSESDQRRLLGLPVVESTDQCDVTALLEKYESNDVSRDMRVRNAVMACRDHDWAHRWRTILGEIGLTQPSGICERIERLGHRAEELEAQL